MAFAKFMSGTSGRLLRAVVGVALILAGFLWIGGTVGVIVGLVGFVPLAAGVFNFCLLAPLFGAYFSGRRNTGS